MGKRGPKIAAAVSAKAKPAWEGSPPWEAKGLTRAGRVIKFIEILPITSGVHAGRKFKLRPWQKEIIKAIYRTVKGKRIVRQAVITIPRKNGKTALASALALAHLFGPEAEERGQIFSAASDRAQASILFNEMVAIIVRIPEFNERCHIKNFHKEITDLENGSVYTALSSDARKAHGLSPSFFVFDELAQSKSRELFDNLQTGTGARAEPLGIVISTQSPDPNQQRPNPRSVPGCNPLLAALSTLAGYPRVLPNPWDRQPVDGSARCCLLRRSVGTLRSRLG